MTNWVLGLAAFTVASLERHPRLRFAPQRFFRPYFSSDVVYVLTSYVVGGAAGFAYVAAASSWLGRLGVPRMSSLALSLWVTVPVALVGLDLFNYLVHVLLHRVDALWETHTAHHSVTELDWLAAFRQHFVEATFRRALTPVLFILVGFPMDGLMIALAITLSAGMLTHANLRLDLGVLEPIFITPRLHRLTPHYHDHGDEPRRPSVRLGPPLRNASDRGAGTRRSARRTRGGRQLSPGLAPPAAGAAAPCRYGVPWQRSERGSERHGAGTQQLSFLCAREREWRASSFMRHDEHDH